MVLALVVSAGVVALIGSDRATAGQEAVHREDRLALAKSLATLAAGYFLQLQASQASVAATVASGASKETLTAAVAKLPGDPVAVLAGPTDSPLSIGPGAGALASAWPQLDKTLSPQLADGGAAISHVEHFDGHATVVLATPGKAIASQVLVVAYRLDALPIAAYVQQLRIGTRAVPYLVDDAGRLVTSPDIAQVGDLAAAAVRSRLAARHPQGVVQIPGSQPQVVAVAAVGLAGWHLVIIQPSPLFYGVLWHADTVFRWLLLGLLIVVASALLMVFG